MRPGYRIRPAGTEDIGRVLSLDQAIENVPHWGIADYAAAVSREVPGEVPRGTRQCLFVAEEASGGAIAGFAAGKAIVLEKDVAAELESVGVLPPARRLGVGRALCSAVVEWAQGQGAAAIELEVRSASDGPIALYKEMGFAPVGRRSKYYRRPEDDAILMRLDLTRKRPPEALPHGDG